MKVYQTKAKKLPGSNYSEVYKLAHTVYNMIQKKTKRRTYIRSAYFKKEKVFLDLFWQHIHEKNWHDKARRLKYYACALELIRNSNLEPTSKDNVNKKSEVVHRFGGITPDQDLFFVQIKENKKTNQKFFISVFPEDVP